MFLQTVCLGFRDIVGPVFNGFCERTCCIGCTGCTACVRTGGSAQMLARFFVVLALLYHVLTNSCSCSCCYCCYRCSCGCCCYCYGCCSCSCCCCCCYCCCWCECCCSCRRCYCCCWCYYLLVLLLYHFYCYDRDGFCQRFAVSLLLSTTTPSLISHCILYP